MKAKDICEIIAELFGSPCNYSPMDEIMLENEQFVGTDIFSMK